MPYRRQIALTFASAMALGLALGLAAPAMADDMLTRMLRGESAMQGKKLAKAIEKAEAFALGSQQNPVRVAMPVGERAYLAQLRCSDGAVPEFRREGSFGDGPYGNILDRYALTCGGGEPKSAEVYMDMYHAGYEETRAVPGFTMAARPSN